jgi:transcriptional regulator with XRE-family HTH domain
VAAELEIAATTLSTLENQQALPRGEMLEKLAGYYQVPISYFFPNEPTKPSAAATGYLQSIRRTDPRPHAVATHSTLDLDHDKLVKIREKMRQKRAEASH